jgi:ABC-type branched-subunit amino acid transport system permease subunit
LFSVDLLLGFTGLLSFGHAAFCGSSAYDTSLIAINWGVPFLVAVFGRAIFAMVVAVPIGLLSVRRAGIYFAIRDNPARARALGYDVERYKLIAFILSAGLAGLAGSVFAVSHGFVSLPELDWTTSAKVVLMTVIGGMGTIWHGPVGAAIIVLLEDALASSCFEGIGIITGAIFIIVVLLFRKGVWGTATVLVDRVAKAWSVRRPPR